MNNERGNIFIVNHLELKIKRELKNINENLYNKTRHSYIYVAIGYGP